MTLTRKVIPAALIACAFATGSMALAQPPQGGPTMQGGPRAGGPVDEAAMLERHIARLHDSLKVTAAQEDGWKIVAQTMRDNEKAMHDLVTDRQSKIDSQTAVQDLNAYADIAALHAQASRKMADVFATFYGSLGAEQKKVADDFFREHKQRGGRGRPPAQPH